LRYSAIAGCFFFYCLIKQMRTPEGCASKPRENRDRFFRRWSLEHRSDAVTVRNGRQMGGRRVSSSARQFLRYSLFSYNKKPSVFQRNLSPPLAEKSRKTQSLSRFLFFEFETTFFLQNFSVPHYMRTDSGVLLFYVKKTRFVGVTVKRPQTASFIFLFCKAK